MVKFLHEIILKENHPSDHVEIYPHGQGAHVYTYDSKRTKTKQVLTKNTIGNEPFKDHHYTKGPNQTKLTDHIRKGRKIESVVATKHPADSSKTLIIDGNHRRLAHKKSGKPTISIHHVDHESIYLHHKGKLVPLTHFRKKGKYDMNKRHKIRI